MLTMFKICGSITTNYNGLLKIKYVLKNTFIAQSIQSYTTFSLNNVETLKALDNAEIREAAI